MPEPAPEAATAISATRNTDDGLAARLRGFGPVGILAILVVFAGNLVFVPLSALLVLAWARWSRTPWREIGYVRPRSWVRDLVLGIVLGIALKLVMKAIVMPLLGADPINRAFHHLVGNRTALPGMLYAIIVGAGFGEETLFRGFTFERLGKLLGSSARARIAIVVFAAVLFGAAHYFEQGWFGVTQATIVGLVFGSIYAAAGRLWMLMWAHIAFDLTALAIIYWDLEATVAHWLFK